MQQPSELLHIYRGLLRATTYLPDSAARVYIHKHVVDRFRRPNGVITDEALKKRLGKARQALRSLERAGNGNLVDLTEVLQLTYGRRGKRRRELLADLLQPDESTIPANDAELEDLIRNPSGNLAERVSRSPRFKAFLLSQQQNQPAEMSRNKIKRVTPKIPKENLWGRPLPRKLDASLRRRFWAATLDKLLPPVPLHDWNRLRDISTGVVPYEKLLSRRSSYRVASKPREDIEEKLLEIVTVPARKVIADTGDELIFNGEEGRLCWANNEDDTNINGDKRCEISPRTMRRLYGSIWNTTSTMSKDEATGRWIVKWGSGRSAASAAHLTVASPGDKELFEGIEDEVSTTTAKTPRKSSSKEDRKYS